MPLNAGAKLGPYEIQSAIGAGGMGEVYRARDSRLNRDDGVIAWSRDGKSVFVQRGLGVPAIVERVEFTTGRRTVVRQVAPEGPDLGLVRSVSVLGWADEGRWFAYSYESGASTLFVVSGATVP